MITVICGVSAIAVLSCVLIKGLETIARGLVCWTFSALGAVLSMAVYFSQNRFSPDFPSIFFALGGVGIMAVIIMLIEFFAPSKRFRKQEQYEYDVRLSESALNLVMIIITAVLGAFACVGEYMDIIQLSGLCLIPASAISIRQLSLYLHLAKLESALADTDERRRIRLMKTLSDNSKRKL